MCATWILREAGICQYPAPPSEPVWGFVIVAGATQVHCMLQSLQVLDALWAPAKGFVMSALWLRMNLRNSDYVLTVKCW